MVGLSRTLVLVSAGLAFALALTAVSGCGGSKSVTQQTMPRLVSSDVERAEATETAAASEAAIGMQRFAHRLLSEHRDLLDGPNGVVSSASIGTAFAMLRAGAEGETAAQIDEVLGFPAHDLGPAYNFLTDRWATEGSDAPELAVANSLFVQNDFDLKRPFLDALARDFGAGVRTVDYTEDAAEVINAWVREQTRDRIQKLFDELPADTRLVLTNAIYVKATWVRQFSGGSTSEGEFRRAEGGPVQVPFMHQTSYFEYARGAAWSALRLPYKGDELSMWVLLPEGVDDPVELLDPDVLAEATTTATQQRVELALPKWDFQSNVPLTAVLPAMGMPRAFTDRAEFPGISETDLMIDQVMHRADITVDEKGTEAAAVTGIGMRVTSMPSAPQATFDADHPFAFVVLHDATGAPLFEGVVGDPSQTQ
jgi:serine protease inhibitor